MLLAEQAGERMTRHAVRSFMTAGPVVIASQRTLADAHQLMREHGVRHLPVVDDGRLAGVVSQRDLYLLETVRRVDAASERVSEAMSPDPYTTSPDAPLDEVAREMAEHRYGSAVVVEGGVVVGMFTTTDALRALGMVLRRGRSGGEKRGMPLRTTRAQR
jgi:acetoin utilization protein AcuB